MRALVLALLAGAAAQAEPLRIHGSPMLARALELAAPTIREELGVDLKFDTQTGSAGALQAIGLGTADLALLLRPMTQEEISAFPAKQPYELEIGVQVLVPIVSRETYETGVQAISRAEFVALYEGDLRTWQRLGGEDREIKFFNPAQKRGVWELFVTWLYGDIRKAPLGKRWEIVETNADARNSVEFNTGSISVAPPQWADGRRVFALALREAGGVLEPTTENFLNRKWPIARPLYLVSGDKPTGAVRKLMEWMAGPRGQEAMVKAEFLPRPEAADKLAERLR